MRTGVFKLITISCLVLFIALAACDFASGIRDQNRDKIGEIRLTIHGIASPYKLDLICWEINNFIRPVPKSSVECLNGIAEEVSTVLREEAIPIIPAVHVRITRPPLLLVVSPRDKIMYLERVLLSHDLNDNEIEELERRIEKLNLSALVVELGGFGAAYPALVSPDIPIKHQVTAVVEEWAHQHLAFRPLGFMYLLDSLGIKQPEEIIAMNETLAGMIADEIGARVYDRFCKSDDIPNLISQHKEFDFAKEMRETRKTVDDMLNQNNVEQAELYMEERRKIFVQNGYRIRKLNQAYFAFHGIYGQDPASVSPVYYAMLQLRNNYNSIADFITDISNMRSFEELQKAAMQLPGGKND